jgi:hypothetical protein
MVQVGLKDKRLTALIQLAGVRTIPSHTISALDNFPQPNIGSLPFSPPVEIVTRLR